MGDLLTVPLQHVSGVDLSTPVDLPTVTIPKVDHVNLVSLGDISPLVLYVARADGRH